MGLLLNHSSSVVLRSAACEGLVAALGACCFEQHKQKWWLLEKLVKMLSVSNPDSIPSLEEEQGTALEMFSLFY